MHVERLTVDLTDVHKRMPLQRVALYCYFDFHSLERLSPELFRLYISNVFAETDYLREDIISTYSLYQNTYFDFEQIYFIKREQKWKRLNLLTQLRSRLSNVLRFKG